MSRFTAKLLNGSFGDAALLLENAQAGTCMLFDLGDLSALSAKELGKISHVFVSHTHIDHFAGFEQLLRQNLSRPEPLYLYGPKNFINQVTAKLKGFTWNLIKDSCYTLEFIITEVRPRMLLRQSLRAANAFLPENSPQKLPFNASLLNTESFSLNCAIFDHGTPCLGFALTEKVRCHIDAPALAEMGLKSGPWLKNLTKSLSLSDDTEIAALDINNHEVMRKLGNLRRRIMKFTPPYKLAYLTDLAYSPGNIKKAQMLVQQADLLYIEAAFIEADAEHGLAKNHLTTQQAAAIIAKCRAKQWQIFHFSHKYQKCEAQVWDEVRTALQDTHEQP